MGFCNRSMFCYVLLYVHSVSATVLMGKRELVALLSLSLCYRGCCVARPRGAKGLSEVSDCGVSLSYSRFLGNSVLSLYASSEGIRGIDKSSRLASMR